MREGNTRSEKGQWPRRKWFVDVVVRRVEWITCSVRTRDPYIDDIGWKKHCGAHVGQIYFSGPEELIPNGSVSGNAVAPREISASARIR